MSADPIGRRLFFRWLARETVASAEEIRGHPHIRVSEIDQVPDSEIERIAPVVDPQVVIIPEPGLVSARMPGCDRPVALFPREPANLFIFNRLDGRATIGQISRETGETYGWTREESLQRVRQLFARLARMRVCVTGNFVGEQPAQHPTEG